MKTIAQPTEHDTLHYYAYVARYHGPTDRTGARVTVTDTFLQHGGEKGKRTSHSYDYARSAHFAAVLARVNADNAVDGPHKRVLLGICSRLSNGDYLYLYSFKHECEV